MTPGSSAVLDDLRSRYSRVGAAPSSPNGATETDVDLRAFFARHRVTDDDALAEVIEVDARCRIAAGLGVELSRYLDAVPGLAGRLVPLDAAIEFSLRAGEGESGTDATQIEKLVRRHPDLEGPIREAVMLSATLADSPSRLTGDREGDVPDLPRGFGPPLPTGRPRYLLKERLGRGSHGEVYLAVDRQLSEESRPALVAIKVQAEQADPVARRRLMEEATKARRVDHPNVVRALDRGRTRHGEDYLVFEYVQGGSLEDRLRSAGGLAGTPMAPAVAARLLAQVARGVQAAHSAGLVHCDLKPGNIILTPDGTPKVADFGVAVRHDAAGDPAAAWDPSNPTASVSGSRSRPIGNLAFISPEQFRCEPGSLAPPSDIYALGGILYYLLTRTLPNGSTPAEVAATHATIGGRPSAPSARKLRREVDSDLDAICSRAMAAEPWSRYGSAEALANDLEAWLRHEPIAWTRPGPWRQARLLVKRQPVVVGAVVLAILIALGVGALLGYQIGRRVDSASDPGTSEKPQ